MQFIFNDKFVETELDYGKLKISSDETKGFRPYQLLVSSIASCSGSVFKQILLKQRTELEQLTIDAMVERNEAEANRIEKITLQFNVKGKNLNEEKLHRNLKIARKHCGMIRSVENSIEIEEKLMVIENKQ